MSYLTEPQVASTYVSKRIGAGATLVTIRDIKFGHSPAKKTPYMRVIVTGGVQFEDYYDYEGVNTNEQATSFDLYLSENAWKSTTAQVLKRIAEKTNNQKYLSLGNLGDDAEELVNIIKPLFIGTKFTLTQIGRAVYSLNPAGNKYYRNVYGQFDPYLNKGVPAPRCVEEAEAVTRVQDYWDKYFLPVEDQGYPKLPSQEEVEPTSDDEAW